jgi:transposase InsO family protein
MQKDKFYSEAILERYRILTLVEEGIINLKEASRELNLSYRHTRRLMKRFERGKKSLACLLYHREHPAWNKTQEYIKKKVVKIFDDYPHINHSHLADKLEEEIGIRKHSTTIKRILRENERYHPPKNRRRKRRPFEKDAFGRLVQMDTSEHLWIPSLKKKTYLVAMKDDFSRAILAAKIFVSDTTWANMCLIREAIEKYGLFEAIYTDNDSKFKFIRSGFSMHFEYRADLERVQTEIHRSLLELGIAFLHHYPGNPEAKGKIERLFGYLQDRFCVEAQHCQSIEEANHLLDKFIEKYNARHIHHSTGVVPRQRFTPSVCRLLPKDTNLDDVFCFKVERVVKRDNTFSYQNKKYYLDTSTRFSWYKAKIRLHVIPHRSIRVFYQGKLIQQFPFL